MLARHINLRNRYAVAIISIGAHDIAGAEACTCWVRSAAAIIIIPIWILARADRNGATTVENGALAVNLCRIIYRRQRGGNARSVRSRAVYFHNTIEKFS